MQFISFIKCNTSIFIIGHLVRQVKRKLIRQWLTSKNFSLSINYNHYKFTVPQHLLFLYCDNAILISTQWHLIKIASRNILSVKWADQLHRCGLVWSTVCREPERIATSTSTMEFFWGLNPTMSYRVFMAYREAERTDAHIVQRNSISI